MGQKNVCFVPYIFMVFNVDLPVALHNSTVYRVAAINPEFFSSYFQMAQHS